MDHLIDLVELEAEDGHCCCDGECEGCDEEGEVDSPAALELGEVALWRLLVRHLDVGGGHDVGTGLEHAQPVGGEREGELVAASLVAEAVEAAEVVRDGGVEGEVCEGEEPRGRPEVAALEAGRRGPRDAGEDERQEEEEGEEEAPELLLLRVGGALLLHRLVEVELHDGAQRLRRRLARDHVDHPRPGAGNAGRHRFPDPAAVVQIHPERWYGIQDRRQSEMKLTPSLVYIIVAPACPAALFVTFLSSIIKMLMLLRQSKANTHCMLLSSLGTVVICPTTLCFTCNNAWFLQSTL
jgi:hypothetical protein